jgi:hypothetical protein
MPTNPTAPTTAPPAPTIAVTLGGITFLNFECPNDEVDTFGGTQAMVKHKFPGGQITTETFGPFPPDIIHWKGQFFQDASQSSDMYDRVDALQQMRVAGQPVTLTVGHFQYQVLLHQIKFGLKLQFWIPYDIYLVTTLDMNAAAQPTAAGTASGQAGGSTTGGSTGDPGGNSATAQPLDPFQVGAPQPGNPAGVPGPGASADQASALTSSNFQLGAEIAGSGQFPNLNASIPFDLTDFQQSLTNAIQQSLSSGASVASPTLQASLEDNIAAVAPLAAGIDPGNAAFGTGVGAILANIKAILIASSQGIPLSQRSKIQLITSGPNPNLNTLALKYYGSAVYWPILAAINDLTTPNPTIGSRILIIPPLNVVAKAFPQTSQDF